MKSINALMKYLRTQKNIDINGTAQKNKLRAIGYYHGYKGYRFFARPQNVLRYNTFNELLAVYEFDMQVKALLYPKIMFLETALKNYALEEILNHAKSERFADVYADLLTNYKNNPIGSDRYKKDLIKRLNLRNRIYGNLSRDYNNKLIVQHFYHKDKPVPMWALFELISFGEFGTLLNCLNKPVRMDISKSIGLNSAFDSDGKLTEIIVYTLKDLRNAIAHNDAIFDTRFKTGYISNRLKKYLSSITGSQNISFNTIVDYIMLVVYLMKCFGSTKNELRRFIRDFSDCCDDFRGKVPVNIYSKIIHTDTASKLRNLYLLI